MSPDDDLQKESLRLHALLIQGDPTAPARLAELHIPGLIRCLARRQSRDEHDPFITTAAHDAFLNYIDRPAQYNPGKLP